MSLTPISFEKVKINSSFWSPKQEVSRCTTVRVCLDECEKSGRLANFRKAAGREEGGFKGIFFDDSDVYKVLEGAAYNLMDSRDVELEARVDQIIDDIIAAQQPDGYINTYYTLTDLSKRWTDMNYHEAYCIGHMIEGAIAYAQATGKTAWLDCARRAVAHMTSIFGPGKRRWLTGHQEIELALVKLYRYTGEEQYLSFARWLIHERGHGLLNENQKGNPFFHNGEYAQDTMLAEEQRRVTGHAVRAMYYYSAMADIEGLVEDEHFAQALDALWHNVIPANYYITGGIGQSNLNEGFTRDFHKPNLTAYCETCAAIGMALWNQRMNLLYADGKYADVVETEMYNGILSGVSLSGERFFYVNPLSSIGRHHRRAWFDCSCCPTNVSRFIPSIGSYAYALGENCLYVNQYIAGEMILDENGKRIQIRQETEYPWKGTIRLVIDELEGCDTICLRVPGWCQGYELQGAQATGQENGYLVIPAAAGLAITLTLDMPPERVYEDERVAETLGRVCVRRGPVVYCAEEIDNPGIPSEYFPAELTLSKDAEIVLGEECEALGGAWTLQADGVKLIPYYAWDNREAGAMAVWLKETEK